jgi:hypothetical protein
MRILSTILWLSPSKRFARSGRIAVIGFVMLAGVSLVSCSGSDSSDNGGSVDDDDWPVTIVVNLETETFTAEGSDIGEGLFCSTGSVIMIFEDSSPTTFYWDIELKCEDDSGSFAVSAETFLEPDESGEILHEDPETGELAFVENSGWWIIEDANGDYTDVTNVQSIGYQELSVDLEGIYQTMYGRLKMDS